MSDARRERPRLVPPAAVERDRILPIIIVVSLLIHLGVLIGFASHEQAGPPALQEIPVELVQLPPPPQPEPPKPQPPLKPEPQPPQKPPPPAPEPPQKPARKATPSTTDRMKNLLGQPPEGMGRRPDDLGDQPLPGATVLPGQAADGAVAVSYSQLVLSQVAKAKKQGRYPGMPGKTVVVFDLADTGEAVNIRIDPPSGNPALDEEATEMVRRGAPYPPPPRGADRHFSVGLVFKAMPE